MRRQAVPRWQQGALLIEAVISAVVIATGLVLISRNVGTQLKTAASVTVSETLLGVARDLLVEMETRQLEALARSGEPLELEGDGRREVDGIAYDWTLSVQDGPDDGTELSMRRLTVRVRLPEGGAAAALSAIWPASWVPDAWVQ